MVKQGKKLDFTKENNDLKGPGLLRGRKNIMKLFIQDSLLNQVFVHGSTLCRKTA